MSEAEDLSNRVSALEREIAELRRRVRREPSNTWLENVAGSMNDFPEFEEVLRLGRRIRKSEGFAENE